MYWLQCVPLTSFYDIKEDRAFYVIILPLVRPSVVYGQVHQGYREAPILLTAATHHSAPK